MRKLLGFTLIIVLCVIVLNFGGYSLNSFSGQIHLRDPSAVLSPITNNIPKGHDIVGDIPNGGEGGYSFDPNAKLDGTTESNNNATYTPILGDENSSINNAPNTSISNESNIDNNSSITEQSFVESKISSEVVESDNTAAESNEDFEDSSENSIENNFEDTDIANINNKIWSFTIGDQTLELTPDNTASFVKWLDTVFTTDNGVYYTNTNEHNNIANGDV